MRVSWVMPYDRSSYPSSLIYMDSRVELRWSIPISWGACCEGMYRGSCRLPGLVRYVHRASVECIKYNPWPRTGEPEFIERMSLVYHDKSVEAGVTILHAAVGFLSGWFYIGTTTLTILP